VGISPPDERKSVSRTEGFPRIWSGIFLYYCPLQTPMTFLTAFHGIWSCLTFPIVHYVYKILISINYSWHCDFVRMEIFTKDSNINLHLLEVFYVSHNRLQRILHKIITVILNNGCIISNVINTIFIPLSAYSNFGPLIEWQIPIRR